MKKKNQIKFLLRVINKCADRRRKACEDLPEASASVCVRSSRSDWQTEHHTGNCDESDLWNVGFHCQTAAFVEHAVAVANFDYFNQHSLVFCDLLWVWRGTGSKKGTRHSAWFSPSHIQTEPVNAAQHWTFFFLYQNFTLRWICKTHDTTATAPSFKKY